jgi:hypothetical protein
MWGPIRGRLCGRLAITRSMSAQSHFHKFFPVSAHNYDSFMPLFQRF